MVQTARALERTRTEMPNHDNPFEHLALTVITTTCLLSDPLALQDVKVTQLNDTHALITWKRPIYSGNATMTYMARAKAEVTDEYILYCTKTPDATIKFKSDVTTIFIAVNYYDHSSYFDSPFYPDPPIQFNVSRKSSMFQNVALHTVH